MMSYLWIFLLASLAFGTNAQDLDLSDALGGDDAAPTPEPAPKEPAPPAPEEPTGDAGDLDLAEAANPEPTKQPTKPTEVTPKPANEPAGGDLDLGDALGPDSEPVPEKPAVDTPTDDANARAMDPAPGSDAGAADEPQEAGAGKIAGIISAVGAAIVGAVTSYIAYQKKKLCFKIQGGDPESANKEADAQNDPQVMSNLLKSS